jgi:hypothetical protein
MFGLGAAIPACGGSVVFEEDGAGGSGGTASTSKSGSGSGSKSASGSKASSSGSNSTVVTTPAQCALPGVPSPQSCQEACSALFDCGLLFCFGPEQNCPGFGVGDKPSFMMGCIDGCNQQPALISVIDPSSCDITIDTVKALSSDFAQTCQGLGDG